jgi:hypothetical protein
MVNGIATVVQDGKKHIYFSYRGEKYCRNRHEHKPGITLADADTDADTDADADTDTDVDTGTDTEGACQ